MKAVDKIIRPTYDEYFMRIAKIVATRSTSTTFYQQGIMAPQKGRSIATKQAA